MISTESLPEVQIIEPKVFVDDRGDFVKTYNRDVYEGRGIFFSAAEEFFSTSRKDVIRGMHFQLPPYDHSKLVYCIQGAVLDVLLDLRRKLPTYGKFFSVELSRKNSRVLFIPAGIAHGFLSLEDHSVMVYKTSTVYAPNHDSGIRWNSFGFAWPTNSPILSNRDQGFPALSDFSSPF